MPKPTKHIAQRRFGQNFLADISIAKKIVQSAQLTLKDTVIEIGPGQGAITELLCGQAGSVYAIELDRDLIQYLKELEKQHANLYINQGDALEVYPSLIKKYKLNTYSVVANIPYNITSAIIRTILQTSPKPIRAILMVQKEVAIRAIAKAGDMSLLALSIQLYGGVRKLFDVAPGSFRPRPKIWSSVIEITPHAGKLTYDPEQILSVAQYGFAHKRKLLVSNLAEMPSLDKERVASAMAACTIAPRARAQDLSASQWVDLASQLL